MTAMTDLTDLIQELQDASEGSRELDAAVDFAMGGNMARCNFEEGTTCGQCTEAPGCGKWLGLLDERSSYPMDWREDERLPRYTTNLQDALDYVVPEGWSPQSVLWNDTCVGCYLRKGLITTGGIDDPNIRYGKGATPALAVSSAALKAREA